MTRGLALSTAIIVAAGMVVWAGQSQSGGVFTAEQAQPDGRVRTVLCDLPFTEPRWIVRGPGARGRGFHEYVGHPHNGDLVTVMTTSMPPGREGSINGEMARQTSLRIFFSSTARLRVGEPSAAIQRFPFAPLAARPLRRARTIRQRPLREVKAQRVKEEAHRLPDVAATTRRIRRRNPRVSEG